MTEGKFTTEDKEQVIEFLNRVAKYAKFEGLNMQELIDTYKSIAYMQTIVLPKIEANVLEVVQVHENEEDEKKEE